MRYFALWIEHITSYFLFVCVEDFGKIKGVLMMQLRVCASDFFRATPALRVSWAERIVKQCVAIGGYGMSVCGWDGMQALGGYGMSGCGWAWDVRLWVGMGCQAVGGYGMSGCGWVWDVRLWVGMGC